MRRRIPNVMSVASAVLAGCTIIIWAVSFCVEPQDCNIPISGEFFIAASDGRIHFYSHRIGPYRGSSLSEADGLPDARGFGDTCGIYYRYFRWARSGNVLWTLSVSLTYPLILFSVLPAVWLWLRRRGAPEGGSFGKNP